jgi:23S rRNA (cytidine1920-2'-O)/16S rRNA (cytidine1409-2'-O)-methyltransferase
MKSSTSMRADQALVHRGLVDSREKAQRLIMAGKVRLNDRGVAKPSEKVIPTDRLWLVAEEKYVSRGGHKLEAALDHFRISVEGKTCLDAGASTGGFTDCLLQRGAARVFCVDVGENQLAPKLVNDPRVVVRDKLNARNLAPRDVEEAHINLVTADVSFISLRKVLPALWTCASGGTGFVTLIKPQFEAGKAQVGKGGVVRDPAVHEAVIKEIEVFVKQDLGGNWQGTIPSPILGPAGNQEFLAYFIKE